ncbi:hypothetical protein RJT34_10407 [Clitoria ternatea]|uniref:Ionotropic glutamate receptor C-terminal domain-containing protein n=1 Tax=Clitoria ternatea TaxID=43366 RepID=A0AAN9PTT2_CLITE
MQSNFVIKLGEKAHVPIITFSATSSSLTSLRSQYSFRISQNDSAQVNAISSIVQAFGWKAAIPIYIDNDYGEGVIPFLTNALQHAYIRIPYLSAISTSASDENIREELYKLMTMQTRVFVVHMSLHLGSRLLTIAKQIGMMSQGYVWIITDGMANMLFSLDSQLKESMQGVLGVKTYIPRTEQFDEFKVRWRRRFLQEHPTLVDINLNVFGVWAYDATMALAMAVEKVGSTNFIGNNNGEKVVSNCARLVVIIWVFVVLILVQSYTASLTSLLTVEKLSPTLTDVNQLMKNKLNVGYYRGSFVYGMLKNMGFQDSHLIPFISVQDCDELFNKGSGNGGIAAAFDETPNLRLISGTYCSKYTILEPTFKTDGYGYVFPRGSPLVADISRAILNVTQGDKMKTIEEAWFNKNNCSETGTPISSDNLSIDSFWGLFLIAGVASVSSLLIFAVRFIHEHRSIWLQSNSNNTSTWKRMGVMLRIFDQKDLSSHAFRKREEKGESEIRSTHHGLGAAFESTTSTYCPPSPSPSGQTESDFTFYGDHGLFSADHGDVNPYGHEPNDMEIKITMMQSVPSPSTMAMEITSDD